MDNLSLRVGRHRAKLRQAGLRPVQIWVLDSRRSGFAEECQRQSQLLHSDPQENSVIEWVESAADQQGWQA